jgi:hypothetical protein
MVRAVQPDFQLFMERARMHVMTIRGTLRRLTSGVRMPLAVAVLCAISVCQSGQAAAQDAVTLGIPGRENAAVRVAASGRFVAVVWGATASGGTDVYSAVSRDAGRTFGAPVRVNDTPFDARVGGELPPQVALVPRAGADPQVVVVWTAKRADGGRLLMSRSADGGATFAPSGVVPGSDAAGNRGWESVTVARDGRVFSMWLDHRDLAMPAHQHGATSAGGPAAPASKADPVERAGMSQLFVASLDGRVAPKSITRSVCYCCKTSLVTGADGAMYGVWRHVYPGDLRDMALTVSRDGGRTFSSPVRVSEDGWEFDGCPDNGPSVAVDASRRVHVAWPAPLDVKNPTAMSLFYATSGDARRFTPRVRIPTEGNAGHVQILSADDGRPLIAWDESASGGRTVRFARVAATAGGAVTFEPASSVGAGKYPALAATSEGSLLVWSQSQAGGSVIAVRRVR